MSTSKSKKIASSKKLAIINISVDTEGGTSKKSSGDEESTNMMSVGSNGGRKAKINLKKRLHP